MREFLNKIFGFSKKTKYKKKTLISSLAPKVLTKKEDIEKVQPYLDKLNETIDTKGISNIALTGGYGSGKSTIIKTFQHLNRQYKYLNISLASFNKKKIDKSQNPEQQKIQKEELERLLEVSILQQIFYHVEPKQIPESRFKRIVNIPGWKICGISLLFIVWLYCSILLLEYNYLDKINPSTWAIDRNFDFWALAIILVAFAGVGMLSKLVISLFSNSKINKVNIKGELELGENVSKSVFNEHLEEILYFFEMTDYDVVIIEDLDRFDSTDIFTKLREINILLNNSKLVSQEVNFVYAIGDDLFEDRKERVKFFEYIIPVIPFINSSNADEQLRTLIKESGLEEDIFTNEFMSDVTTFIDDIDMRLLINIFHEFVIYRQTLTPDLVKKNDELFAMITYKNLDPKDFNLLNKRDGELYKLINNKKEYIKELVGKIDDEIRLKTKEIKDIENHLMIDLDELKNIYLQKILSKLPQNTLLNDNIINLDLEDLKENPSLVYQCFDGHNRRNRQFDFVFTDIEKEVNPNYTYDERVRLVTSKHSNKADSLKSEIEKLKKKKSEIENWDLRQIFNEIGVNQYFDVFSNSKLLRNLVLEGYINENYNDYISLFYEGALTIGDKKFEQNVKAQYSPDFKYELTNVENLVGKSFELKHYRRESILNFDLVTYLGKNYGKYSDKYESIIQLLSNEKETSIKFIAEYVEGEERPIKIFIEKLTEHWEGFVEYFFDSINLSEKTEDKFLELIIRHSKNETILKNQNTAILKNRIDETRHFVSLFPDADNIHYIGKVTKLLIALGVKFKKLDAPEDWKEGKLLKDIYGNNLYRINPENLLQIISLFGKDVTEEEFYNSNYSAVLKSNYDPVIKYVKSNIETYIKGVYLILENNDSEEEENYIELLNNSDLEFDLIWNIVEKVKTKISDLGGIDMADVKSTLLHCNKVVPTWDNVADYYASVDNIIDEKLVGFLSYKDVQEALSKDRMKHEDDSFDYPSFRKDLLLCDEIPDESYTIILSGSIYTRDELPFENLSETKVTFLINNVLTTTKANYDLAREHFTTQHIRLLEKDFSKFIQNIDDFETDEKDIVLLLKSSLISIEDKLSYIPKIDEQLITNNSEIAKAVGGVIHDKYSEIVFNSVETVVSIIANTFGAANKVRLIVLFINQLDELNLISLLKTMEGFDKLFEAKRPTFIKSDENKKLLDILMSKNLIKRFYDDKWSNNKYRVTTNY